jgi:hypothetical protein
MTLEERREMIFQAVEEAVDDLLYDDRKGDEILPQGEIEKAVQALDVTIAELTFVFSELLRRKIPVSRQG